MVSPSFDCIFFHGLPCLVMEIAVLIAAGLREWIDFGVIIAILLLNATVGWYQEKQAADVVASLKGDIAMRATVVRNGKEEDIKARELVPGDIVSTSPPLFGRYDLTKNRSLSKKAKLFQLMPVSSVPTRTPTLSKNTKS